MQRIELDQKYSKTEKTAGVNLCAVLFSAPGKKFLFSYEKMDIRTQKSIHMCMYRFRNRYIFNCTSHTSIEMQLAQLPPH